MLLYDGTCRFCEASSRQAMKIVSPEVIERRDINDPLIQARYEISSEAAQREMYLVDPAGNLSHGAGAVRELLKLSGWAWPLAWFWKIPGVPWIAQHVYLWIADHRYLIMGRAQAATACEDGACSVHLGRAQAKASAPPSNPNRAG